MDIIDTYALIPLVAEDMTYYEVGKLTFDLLLILLSRIEALGGEVHQFTAFLRSHPPFYLIKDDPLEFEKLQVTQAIEQFLKV